jgi:hypothetical protein
MNEEPNTDEAKKADDSQVVVESPATEEVQEETQVRKPEEAESEQVETESAEEESTQVPQEAENRKTASSRIKELVTEKKEAEAKAESLAEQLRKVTTPQVPTTIPEAPQDDNGQVAVQDVLRQADALTQIRLAQQENLHRVDSEALDAIKANPELDPDSDSFDKDLSESVSQATLAFVQANPTGSVRKFVDSLMKPYRRSVDKQAQGQVETITKQVSQQAMRPTQVQEQEKPFSELSIEEMEKKLPKVYR